MASNLLKSNNTIEFPSIAIYWYEAKNTINPFKQPKCVQELKLANFKNYVYKLQEYCLPA